MSYRCRAGARVVYDPETIHEEISPCESAPRTVQSAAPAGAPTDMNATPRVKGSAVNSRPGRANDPVVRRFTWPENTVSVKKPAIPRRDPTPCSRSLGGPKTFVFGS